MYILVQKGQNNPYYVPGQKWARLMNEYLLYDICDDLKILMTGGMEPEYYTHFLFIFIFVQVLNG